MIIRKADFNDIPWIRQQLEDFSKVVAVPTAVKMPSEEYVTATLTEMIRNHVVIVATDDLGAPAGLIAGVINNNMMNPGVTYLTEMMWWVVPGYRKQGVGKALLAAFVAVGRETESVEWITISLENNTPLCDTKVESLGFRLAERTFVMEA